MSTRILIGVDQPLIRSGIISLLSNYPDMEFVGEAINGAQVIQLARITDPDILILDTEIPNIKPIQILSTLRSLALTTRVIILSIYSDAPTVISLLKAGVKGYLLKSEVINDIVASIRVVMDGKLWLSPAINNIMKEIFLSNDDDNVKTNITYREMEILQLLAKGKTYKQIGIKLCISDRTIRYDIEKVINKLDVHNRNEALALAIQKGWISV